MTAAGVTSFGVVAGQPSEDLAAAGRRVRPVAAVLEDFAFDLSLDTLGESGVA